MPLRNMRMDEAAKWFYRKLETKDLAAYTLQQKRRTIDMLVAEAGASTLTKFLKYEHFDAVIWQLRHGASPEENEARRLKGYRTRDGIAEHNMTFYKGTLRQFVDWLKHRGCLSMRFDPLYEITKSKRATGTHIVQEITAIPHREWPAFLALAAQGHPRDFTLCLLGLTQGRRVSELQIVKIGDIDWDNSEIKWTNVKKGFEFRVPYDLATERFLMEYLDWYRRVHGDLQPDWYLLPSRMSTKDLWSQPNLKKAVDRDPLAWPLNPTKTAAKENLIRAVKAVLRAHGWEDTKGEGVHTLRRSYAQAVEELESEVLASAGLGHKSSTTTRDHYTGDVVKRRQLAKFAKGQDPFGLLPRQPGPDDTPDSNVIQLESRRKVS